jgi:LEA14-like dessication related protein
MLRAAMRLLPVLCVLMLLGAGSSGCVRKPQVALRNVQLTQLGLLGGSLLVTLEVTNPNSFTLNADTLTYALELEGTEMEGEDGWVELASGTYPEPVSIPPGQSVTIQVPVDFDYSRLGSSGLALLRTGGLDYRAGGTVLLHTPLGTHSVPFKKQGVLGRK